MCVTFLSKKCKISFLHDIYKEIVRLYRDNQNNEPTYLVVMMMILMVTMLMIIYILI